MKLKLAILFLLTNLSVFSQITSVACGEYRTAYLHNDSTVWATLWNGKYQYMQYAVKSVVDVAGGQYTCLAWTRDGVAYELGQNSQGGPLATKITIPTRVVYGQMFYQAILLVDELGDLYYLATSSDKDVLKLGISSTPKLILKGWNIAKVAVGETQYGLLLLTKNGAVLKLEVGTKVPTEIALPNRAIDIAMVGRGAYVVNTGIDLLAWGPRANYVGLAGSVNRPTSIRGSVKFPIKKIAGNWNTLHIIDANGDMWAVGDNIMGELGNGQGNPSWKTYKAADGITPQPFSWNWLPAQMIQGPVKLDGKWADVFTSGSMAFYLYAIDQKGQLYSWGRNKKRALGNGRTLPDNDLDAKYSDWEDQYYPTRVDPDKVTWTVINTFDPNVAVNNAAFTLIAPEVPSMQKITIASNEFAALFKALKPGSYEFSISVDTTSRKVVVSVQ